MYASSSVLDSENMLNKKYTNFYTDKSVTSPLFPSEMLVRIFMGEYRHINLRPLIASGGLKLCDVGCGAGGNFKLYSQFQMELCGVELTQEICVHTLSRMQLLGIKADIRVGSNHHVPFASGLFDILVSWNSSYYMGGKENARTYEQYVMEFGRVLNSDGILIMSVPMKTNFIFEKSSTLSEKYVCIEHDPFGIRDGQVFRRFNDQEELTRELSLCFEDFRVASVVDDCFGQNNHWYIVACKKNGSAYSLDGAER